MANDYIVTLDGHNILREIELGRADSRMRAGTEKGCDVRFRKDLFFAPFVLDFVREDEGFWSVSCSEEVYFGTEGVGKSVYRRLSHGDTFTVRYADSGAMLFTAGFSIDFERVQGDYDRSVDIESLPSLTIGGRPGCGLQLRGSYVVDDLVAVRLVADGIELTEKSTRYGVLCDGRRMTGTAILPDMTFFSIANYSFYYNKRKLYFSRIADIAFNGVAYEDERPQCITSEYPRFNRNTRIRSVVDNRPIPILEPPTKHEKPKSNIIVQLLPAIGMLAVIVLLRGSMGNSAGSAFIWISAASMGVGILATVLGIVTERRRYKKELSERKEKYTSYIEKKRGEIEDARAVELKTLESRYRSPRDELGMVAEFSGNLFDRRPGDDDFLHFRVGIGPRPSARQINRKDREAFDTDELSDMPASLCEEYAELLSAPITVDLETSNAVGVVGPQLRCMEFMRNMVLDLVTRHYEADLKVFALVEEKNADAIKWARLLPHFRNDELYCWNIVCDEESRNVLFEYLYKTLTARAESKKSAILPRIVVMVIDDCGLKNHPLSQFVDNASAFGVTYIFFERAKEYLPLGCDWIVKLDAGKPAGSIVSALDDRMVSKFVYEPVEEERTALVANKLAPVFCEEVSLEGSLTKSISLFELFGIMSADDLDLGARWASTAVDKSLSVPIGVTKSKVIDLDLHDKAHGPHGLVAGTTGSGKSEILQTYILSIATYFHPYEVSFLIIDFKGGGMVNQFRDLPHLAGAITNIDGREIDRSLKSIKAELQKRQRYFADADVNHISNYIRKFKAGEISEPLPHLIIIVDEFAELKAEQPDFMKELISASRIGRSLGVHLILATQKPSGQVSEQIWSNSRFKLCLKVQSKEDSNEVIKSPLAAEIKEPGRAYLQVGNNEIFELFQSGFSGAPERESDDNTREFTIYEMGTYGKRIPVFSRRRKKSDGISITQLDAVVSHIARYCEDQRINRLPSICLPPLEECISFPSSITRRSGSVPLGVYDDPNNQYQGVAFFDLDAANTFVIGSSQTGKTNFLQAIVRAIAQGRKPSEAAIYIMDFASMVLKNFEGLAHVGGVVLPGEDEKVKNLFKLINGELAARKRRLLEVGVSSFSAYLEAGHKDMPHIYLLLDNFAVFKELYSEGYEDDFVAICRDGISYGVTVVVSNSSTSGFSYRYLSNFSSHIAFSCNDANEYSMVFDKVSIEPKHVPGRALCSFDKELYEFQAYLAFEGEREIDRVSAISEFIERVNDQCAGERVRAIPSVPDALDRRYLVTNYDIAPKEMVFALSYATVEPVRIDLDSQFSLAVIGKEPKRRIAVMRSLLAEIHDNIFDREVELHIVDGVMKELQDVERLPYVETYTSEASQAGLLLERLNERLKERYARVAEAGIAAIKDEPYIILILNSLEAIEHLSADGGFMGIYGEMAKQYATMHALVVFGDLPDSSVSYSSAALLKAIKEERRAFVASNMAELKFFEMPPGAARAYKTPLEDGQAFYINGTETEKVKLADDGTVGT